MNQTGEIVKEFIPFSRTDSSPGHDPVKVETRRRSVLQGSVFGSAGIESPAFDQPATHQRKTVKDFTCQAPTLFDASATPAAVDELHDAPGAAGSLARTKRFAAWLKSEISDKGMLAFGPSIDETGWIIVVHPVGGGHVYALASEIDGHEGLFSLIVWELGNATKDVGEAIESILRNASEITELKTV